LNLFEDFLSFLKKKMWILIREAKKLQIRTNDNNYTEQGVGGVTIMEDSGIWPRNI